MAQANSSERNRWLLIATVITLGLISLVQTGCSCGSSSSLPPPDPVTSVYPPQSTDGALVSTLVTATFRDDMNGSTIDTTTFTLTVGGAPVVAGSVVYDATTKTATLTPAADLTSDTEYRATISSSVENLDGNKPLASDYVWSFTVSPDIYLVSENESGIVGNDFSSMSAVDEKGRYIVFESESTNLADIITTFNRNHIYRKDTITGEVMLVSSTAAGLEADNKSFSPSISDDGRYIAFESTARNLVTSVGNNIGSPQIYLKDMDDGTIIMISRNATDASDNGGSENPDISSDGRFIVFESDSTNLVANAIFIKDIYLADTDNPYVFDPISVNTSGDQDATGSSINPSVSNDGRFVAFESIASTLVVTDTNGASDVFMRDRGDAFGTNPATVLISQDSTGSDSALGPSNNPYISGNGLSIVFESLATNIDGGVNGIVDIFLSDTINPAIRINTTSSSSADANSANPSISDDGRYVVFESLATNLDGGINGISNIFARDTQTSDAISRLSTGSTDHSYRPAISSNGRYVSFDSPFNFTSDDDNTVLDSDVYRVYNSTFQ